MSHDTIQSVIRCLDILEKLSSQNGSSIFDIAASTGLPRGTVHRMLETLSTAGYVRKDNYLGCYWLESKAGMLGHSYIDQSWILDGAADVINTLRREIHWCLTISVPDGDFMTIRIATRLKNPQGGTKTFAGERKAIGQSSEGHVFLAHCGLDVRDQMLDRMYNQGNGHIDFLSDRETTSQDNAKKLLNKIRIQGYSTYDVNSKTKTISLPILREDEVLGVITMTFFITGVTDQELLNDYVIRLQIASNEISRRSML